MNIAFKISLLANVCLIVVVALFASAKKESEPVPAIPAVEANVAVAANGSSPAAVLEQPTRASQFRWNQIESSDYHLYVANLRSIGCPEQTIRDIISADVDTLYALRREQLEQQMSSQGKTLLERSQMRSIEGQLRSLHGEEEALIAELLGGSVATAAPVADARPTIRPVRSRTNETAIVTPLVFQPVDLASLKLSRRQMEMIDHLRQQFMDEIGGPNQDPNDPAYAERWRNSQPAIDEQLRGLIGVNQYQNYQLQAAATSKGQTIDFPDEVIRPVPPKRVP